MKALSLRPYHGQIRLCASLDELLAQHYRLTRAPWPYGDSDPKGGRFVLVENGRMGDRVFLVYGHDLTALAHEFAHVLLIVFRTIGHDPREGDGEPFCYMLSQLLSEAK